MFTITLYLEPDYHLRINRYILPGFVSLQVFVEALICGPLPRWIPYDASLTFWIAPLTQLRMRLSRGVLHEYPSSYVSLELPY